MYKDEQPVIGEYARASADNFARVCLMAVLTIQNPLYRVPEQMRLVDEIGDKARGALFGHKVQAFHYLRSNRKRLFADCEAIWESREAPDAIDDRLLLRLSQIPGVGLVKAGFIAQLAYGTSGCIDTHNLVRFDIPMGTFKSKRVKGTKPATAARWVRYYNETIDRLGGTASLWDSWCAYVAEHAKGWPVALRSPEAVSRCHLAALGIT